MALRNCLVLILAFFVFQLYRFNENLNEEFFFKTDDFIKKFGYDCEQHVVESVDGFISTLFRVLPKKAMKTIRKRPILLEGGIFCSSDLLVMHRNNLAFFLVDAGHDVWLGNYRGSRYCQPGPNANHSDPFIQHYGYHEMGVFDFSISIDYILDTTGFDKINFGAVSVGSNSLLALLSTKPEYNEKINKALHFGSGFSLKMNNLYQKMFFQALAKGSWLVLKSGILEPWPMRPMVAALLCQHTWMSNFCLKLLEESTGLPNGHNTTEAALMLTLLPSGSPVGVVDHLLQLSEDGADFRMRDYGHNENMMRYNSSRPPLYDVSRITVPTKVYYAQDDSLVRHEIAKKVFNSVPNKMGDFIVAPPFSHVNFLTNSGRNKEFVNDVLRTFSND